jgi:hypothetical protein
MRRAFELGSDVHKRFMKGSLARVEAGAQTEDNYSHTKVAENARAARKRHLLNTEGRCDLYRTGSKKG